MGDKFSAFLSGFHRKLFIGRREWLSKLHSLINPKRFLKTFKSHVQHSKYSIQSMTWKISNKNPEVFIVRRKDEIFQKAKWYQSINRHGKNIFLVQYNIWRTFLPFFHYHHYTLFAFSFLYILILLSHSSWDVCWIWIDKDNLVNQNI